MEKCYPTTTNAKIVAKIEKRHSYIAFGKAVVTGKRAVVPLLLTTPLIIAVVIVVFVLLLFFGFTAFFLKQNALTVLGYFLAILGGLSFYKGGNRLALYMLSIGLVLILIPYLTDAVTGLSIGGILGK